MTDERVVPVRQVDVRAGTIGARQKLQTNEKKGKEIDRRQEENPTPRRKRSPAGNRLFGDVEDGRGPGPWKTNADYSGRWRDGSLRPGRRCTTVTCVRSSGSSITSWEATGRWPRSCIRRSGSRPWRV